MVSPVLRQPGPKIRIFDRNGGSSIIGLDYLPFGHAGGGKASGDVTSAPAGWSEITFTNLIFDQEVDENPTLFDAGGINIAIFFYLMKSVLGITPNILTNKFYYQQEQVTGLKANTTRDITGWIGGSIVQSQTSEYDRDIAYWRIKKFAFVDKGKWRVVQLNTDIVGPKTAAIIINQPTNKIYVADPTFDAGVFGTRVTTLRANTDDVRFTSLDIQTSGLRIGLRKKDDASMYGLGRYTPDGKLIEVLNPGEGAGGKDAVIGGITYPTEISDILNRDSESDITFPSAIDGQFSSITGNGSDLYTTNSLSPTAIQKYTVNEALSAISQAYGWGGALNNSLISSLCTDGTTLWVGFNHQYNPFTTSASSNVRNLYAFNLSTGARDSSKDITGVTAAHSVLTSLSYGDGFIAAGIWYQITSFFGTRRAISVSLFDAISRSRLNVGVSIGVDTTRGQYNRKPTRDRMTTFTWISKRHLYVISFFPEKIHGSLSIYKIPDPLPESHGNLQPVAGPFNTLISRTTMMFFNPQSSKLYVHAGSTLIAYNFTPLVSISPSPGADPPPLYSICKRAYVGKPKDAYKPINIVNTDDGMKIPIELDLTNFLTQDINPLALDSNVKWSGIAHDRQNKFLLTTYNDLPPEDADNLRSKLIIIPTTAQADTDSGSSNFISFINGSKTRNANELAFIDEIGKIVHLLSTTDDTWKDDSYALYSQPLLDRTASDALRSQILATLRSHPLGVEWLSDGEREDNPLYSYREYLPGVNDNLFPKYINNWSMAMEVGEFRSGIFKYEEDTYQYNSYKNSRDWQWDRSHNSTLYDKGRKIQFMHTPTLNASALHDISTGGPWRAITSKRAANSRQELMALDNNNMIHWWYYDGSALQKRTLPLTGASLVNVTGIEWIGDNLYVCDSGRRNNQIQKYSVSTTAIAWSKEIANPRTNPATFLGSINCRTIPGTPPKPGSQPQQKTRDAFFSGFYPIDNLAEFLSGQNHSLRIKILHTRYLDIGSLFIEASGPRVGPGK